MDFESLKKYMFTTSNISMLKNKNKIKNIPTEKPQKKCIEKKSKKKYITEKDKLFWYLYIFENGQEQFDLLGRNKYSEEMKLKVNYIEDFKNAKKLLKENKLKFNDLQENLLYDKINIFTLYAITLIKHINFIYYTDNTFFINKKYQENSDLVIYYDRKDKIFMKKDFYDIDKISENRLQIFNLKKPLKSLSAYKIPELHSICKILNINIMKNATKKLKKKELYEKIVQKIE